MDAWLYESDRSVLYSDEGPPFGHQGVGPWDEEAPRLRAWLVRKN